MTDVKTAPDEPAKMMRFARNADVGFVAAETVLALRAIQVALLAMQVGDKDAVSEQISILAKRADDLWSRFEELTDSADD